MCWLTKEPVTSLLGGIIAGALLLGRYDFTGEVLIPSLATKNAAGVLLLYLWLLGGLMGIWSRTGAAQAFAEFMTVRFCARPQKRQAGRLDARGDFLPGRHCQHGAGRHYGQTDCGQREN